MSLQELLEGVSKHLTPVQLRTTPLHTPIDEVRAGLRGQGSECPRCGAKGRVSATCAEFLSQPFPEALRPTAKRVHDKVARGHHSHLKCAHDDCGLVTIGVGVDTQKRLYKDLCGLDSVVRGSP